MPPPTAQQLLTDHLAKSGESVADLSKRSGVGEPTLRGLIDEGKLPRKPEHREFLREVLGLDTEAWAESLMMSSGIPLIEDRRAPVQVLMARAMFRQGMTEQSLARLADVPYGAVLGMMRKGSIPRGKTLDRLGDALGLEPAVVAAAAERAKNVGDALSIGSEPAMPTTTEGLAQLVARRIREQDLTIGTYAAEHGLGYLALSRFLESGEPPQDQDFLGTIQKDLDLNDDAFESAISTGRHTPKPGTVQAKAGEPPPDASPLQVALLQLMQDRKLTIKGLAQVAGLSQITVSRLVKQGATPSRTRTHHKLRDLLGLEEQAYRSLVAGRSTASEALAPKSDRIERSDPFADADDGGEEEEYHSTDAIDISKDELVKLVRRLNRSQRATLASFLRTLLGQD